MEHGIRSAEVSHDDHGRVTDVRLVFGPHYFLELHAPAGGGVEFLLGATHHGFRADASEVNGELEHIIREVRESHPQSTID